MVDQIIRPANLPDRPNPVSSEKVPVDNGVTVGGATIQSMVLAGRPTATEADAIAGTNPLNAMTPLTTAQAIAARAMEKSIYDPQNINADAFSRANQTGTQTASTISDFAENVPIYGDRDAAAALDLSKFSVVEITRWSASSPVAPAHYERVAQPANVEPPHSGKFKSVDGAWWSIAETVVSNIMMGAIADNVERAVGTIFATLALAQERYPFVQSLDESLDYCAFQAALDYIAATPRAFSLRVKGNPTHNREAVVRASMTIAGEGTGDSILDWRQSPSLPLSGTTIRMYGDASTCKTVKTRRRYRGALDAPKDEPFAAALNIQAASVKVTGIRFLNDFDPALIVADPGFVIPAVAATFNTDGEAVAPGFYGAPAVTTPTYFGAGWDVGIFIGCRTDVQISDDVHCVGFRFAGIYNSGADSLAIPRLKDWRGAAYPQLLFSGSDGFKAYDCTVWGSKHAILSLGAEPRQGLYGYGKNYTTRLPLTFLAQPNGGDLLTLGSVGTNSVFEFVAPVSGNWPAASGTNVRVRIMPTMAETLYELEIAVNAESYRQNSSSNSLIFADAGFLGGNVFALVPRVQGTNTAASFAANLRASTSNAAARISIPNGGVPLTSQGDYAPYFWADETTSEAEKLAVGYGDGSYADDRTTVGMSDQYIKNCNLRGIRRGTFQLGQINLRRDPTKDDRGATIWIDGIAGNGSGRIQKVHLSELRVGFSGMATALKLGFVNLIYVDELISDENSSALNTNSVNANVWGWYSEHRRNGVQTARFYGDPAESTPSPFLSRLDEYSFTSSFGRGGLAISKGFWSPRIEGLTVPGVQTYAQQRGTWELIGDVVTCFFRFQLSAKDAAASGVAVLAGLPFPISTGGEGGAMIHAEPLGYGLGFTLIDASYGMALQFAPGVSYATFVQSNMMSVSTMGINLVSGTAQIRGSFQYRVA